MNLQQYAEHRKEMGLRGATHVSVLRAIKKERLRPPAVERQGSGWEIDPVLADQQWAQTTDPAPRGSSSPSVQLPKTASQPRPAKVATNPAAKIPDYNESRARSEFEKANILEMERREKANSLLPREDCFQAWDAAVNITRTTMLGVASKLKQRIPHLTPDEVQVAQDLIREALGSLASGDLTERYPEAEL